MDLSKNWIDHSCFRNSMLERALEFASSGNFYTYNTVLQLQPGHARS